jgi:hypothetical protein
MSEVGERRRPSCHAYTEHIPNRFGISSLAILRPILVHSSVTTSQTQVTYSSMPFPKVHRNTYTLRKNSSENLTLGDDRAHEIASRIQITRTTRFETDLKNLNKKLGDREKIVPQRLDKRNTPSSNRLTHLHRAHKSTLPFPLSPKVMYSLVIIRVRPENHRRSLVMCHEQPESINQKPSMPATCKIKNESESEQKTQHWV